MNRLRFIKLTRWALLASSALLAPAAAFAQLNTLTDGNDGVLPTPPGLYVTPVAPLTNATQQALNPGLSAYPNFVAGEAVKAVPSPDGTLLAILTAGQNSLYNSAGNVDTAASTQFIFIYNIAGANKSAPVLQQVIQQNNAYVGLVWSTDGNTLYAAGGNDDCVYVYNKSGSTFAKGTRITLGHTTAASTASLNTSRVSGTGIGLSAASGGGVQPNTAGLAVSADGKTLVVANNYNDSISVIDTATGIIRYEHDLRPYFARNEGTSGVKGGSFPYAVAMVGNVAYVGADRDREVVAVNVGTTGATSGTFVGRIQLPGNPNGMTVKGTTLFVAQDNQDKVAMIDTATNTVTAEIDTRGPASLGLPANLTGSAPTAVTVSPDGNTLYAINAGSNSVAVIPLNGANPPVTTGLIPTAYDPTDIAFSPDGGEMYIVNGKSDQGPNTGYGFGNTALLTTIQYPGGNTAAAAAKRANNQYQFQLEHATLVSAQTPAAADLPALTSKVAENNLYSVTPPASDATVMNFLHGKIQHIIYIVKENRTFDQILGDLNNGSDGDPSLTLFGKRITPNFHRMAQNFVTLDNFMDPGDGSMDGWSWSMRGRVTNTETIAQQENYAAVNRGLSYEGEGQNRNIPVNLSTTALRNFFFDPTGATTPYTAATAGTLGGTANVLVGDGDHAATDGPDGYQKGYIFNVVLDAGGTVRNYGWQANTPGSIGTIANPISDPFSAGVIQTTAANSVIATNNYYDPYFRAFDMSYPDLWRFNEWNREFQQFVANGNLPSLEMIRGLSHDHTGNFGTALGGVNTPELQQADNDFAVGKLVDAVAHSPYAANTLIIVIEDDSQDGADHVDSHRSTTYFVGPYVKHNAVVSTRYSQPNVLRTIEDILGTQHVNLNTAYARPMADVFDITSSGAWTYSAIASTILKTTTLQLSQGNSKVRFAEGPDIRSSHDAAWWAEATRGFDFSGEDRVPTDLYNEVLWKGLKGNQPFPAPHHSEGLGGKILTSK